uniref:Uncharacterized protein n=1 Tax=Chelonoidis abingdonii TaxID=106734 RepID=A0A8C0G5A8_CHEAB
MPRGDWELPPTSYLSQSGSEARLSQPRSHLSRAAAKSRCTTSKSAASSNKEVAGAGTGDKDRGSLLLRKPAGPLSPAKDTGKSFFMVLAEWRLLACGLGYVPLNPVPDLLRSHRLLVTQLLPERPPVHVRVGSSHTRVHAPAMHRGVERSAAAAGGSARFYSARCAGPESPCAPS